MCGGSFSPVSRPISGLSVGAPPAAPAPAPVAAQPVAQLETGLLDKFPQLNQIPSGSLDFTKPLAVVDYDWEKGDDLDDGVTFEAIAVRPGLDFPIIVEVNDNGERGIVAFDEDGDEDNGGWRLINKPQQETDDRDDAEPSAAAVDLPQALQRGVYHHKRGSYGTTIKVRAVDPKGKGRLVMIRLDNPGFGKDADLWALPGNFEYR